MSEFSHIGKTLLIVGLVIAATGLLMALGGKIPWIGRLPGDIFIRGKHVTFYFPVMTSIVISILLTVLLYLFRK